MQYSLSPEKFKALVEKLSAGLNLASEDLESFTKRFEKTIINRADITWDKVLELSSRRALDELSKEYPEWQYLAGRLYLQKVYLEASENRGYEGFTYGPFQTLINLLVEKGIYSEKLFLEKYSAEDIELLGSHINADMDLAYSYLSLNLVATRYLATDHSKNTFELPQERNMVIAMNLMQDEKEDRIGKVLKSYWALSNRYQTVATPTMKNSGLTYGQYSSCFIDTVEDSLDGIYFDNLDVARLSKDGGGIGVYLGKIRARGSDIKGFKNTSSGLIPWMKQLNNTAVSVDQLGQRNGAIKATTDIWHKDAPQFLEARLNNGDERFRTHDLSLGVTIPDLFMEKYHANEEWHLLDPHEVRTVYGWGLEDFYDEEPGEGSFRERYELIVSEGKVSMDTMDAKDVMRMIVRSQKETGYPFLFFRDEVNRQNPNKHAGMIYSSNLCQEITQNMSATTLVEEYIVEEDGTDYTILKRKNGDFVVCNLASINLATALRDDVLEELIPAMVRGLDNVIDLNNLAVPQATTTNRKYRAIGLGTFGWHHHLAISGIAWESERAVEEADKVNEKIAFLTIKSSMELAVEKGAYPLFEGSEWHTGEYFVRKGYVGKDEFGALIPVPGKEEWYDLAHQVMQNGIRNGYLMAVAPNMSTAKAGGSTDGIDPVFDRIYAEEKKNYKIPTTVPDLGPSTFFLYKNGFAINQDWSVKQNAARQKHIDQSISFNLYVPEDVTAKRLVSLITLAWESKMKTIYYVRSQSAKQDGEMDEGCDACQ